MQDSVRNLSELGLPDVFTKLSIEHQKRALRTLLKDKRTLDKQSALPEHWGDAQMQKTLVTLGLSLDSLADPKVGFQVGCYFPIQDELNLATFASSQWLFPKTGPRGSLRWFRRGLDSNRLVKNAFGIPEAEDDECFVYDPHTHGPMLLFVPCLAASVDCFRLGYGGGFFDRFLSQNSNSVLSVACVPPGFVFDRLPHETHDWSVDVVSSDAQTFHKTAASQLLCKLRT